MLFKDRGPRRPPVSATPKSASGALARSRVQGKTWECSVSAHSFPLLSPEKPGAGEFVPCPSSLSETFLREKKETAMFLLKDDALCSFEKPRRTVDGKGSQPENDPCLMPPVAGSGTGSGLHRVEWDGTIRLWTKWHISLERHRTELNGHVSAWRLREFKGRRML